MSDALLAAWPRSLRERTRLLRLGPAPALLVAADGDGPAPLLLWLHGRGATKELDSARYLRLARAGIATCALDLPGHGERADPARQEGEAMQELLSEALAELDEVLRQLLLVAGPGVDPERLALGGMSAGGMIALRRLGDPHPFRCAAVEGTAGDFAAVGEPRFLRARAAGLDPVEHLAAWRPIPLLALHSEADQVVPLVGIASFVRALQERYRALGADAGLVQLVTWPETGAPLEHLGFGRMAAQARARLVEFLAAALGAGPAA